MIYVVGDTHGENDSWKLNNPVVRANCNDSFPDYVIVAGDFGFIWENRQTETEKYYLSWLAEKPWKTLFIDGNHENFFRLNQYETTEMFGATVHKINDSIYHLMRGNVYTIEDKKIFTCGGAMSTDKQYRQEFVSWWRDEELSSADIAKALDTINKNPVVDYVITHTAPSFVVDLLHREDRRYDPTSVFLEEVSKLCTFKKWYFGHMHVDKTIDKKYICCYNIGHILE